MVGEEELLQQFDRVVSMIPNKSIAQELRRRVEASRLDVIRSLGKLGTSKLASSPGSSQLFSVAC